jgi:PIN like domain
MGRSLGRRLAAEGLRVILHDDEFEQGTPDQEWLSVVGAHGWIELTKESRLRFRPLEREALIAAILQAAAWLVRYAPSDCPEKRDFYVASRCALQWQRE